jgi:hypothetical protein
LFPAEEKMVKTESSPAHVGLDEKSPSTKDSLNCAKAPLIIINDRMVIKYCMIFVL